jgi:hypothetical protein
MTTGPEATHRFACHNPPTAEEAAVGRPLREGFVAAPPPGAVIEQLVQAQDVAPLEAEEVALFDAPGDGTSTDDRSDGSRE